MDINVLKIIYYLLSFVQHFGWYNNIVSKSSIGVISFFSIPIKVRIGCLYTFNNFTLLSILVSSFMILILLPLIILLFVILHSTLSTVKNNLYKPYIKLELALQIKYTIMPTIITKAKYNQLLNLYASALFCFALYKNLIIKAVVNRLLMP